MVFDINLYCSHHAMSSRYFYMSIHCQKNDSNKNLMVKILCFSFSFVFILRVKRNYGYE